MMKGKTKGPGRPKGTGRARGSIPYLNEDELSRLFSVIRKERSPDRRLRNELIFRMILFYGMRVGEASGIRRNDIHLDSGEIQIAGLKRGSIRTYSIDESILPLLRRWLKKTKGEYLFPHQSRDDRGISKDLLQFLFKKYARAAGLSSGYSIQSLRHSCAIMMAQAEASPIRIQHWLRQKRVSSAQVYFNAVQFKDDDRKMAQLFKGLF
jgi:integrase/recombinase XerD